MVLPKILVLMSNMKVWAPDQQLAELRHGHGGRRVEGKGALVRLGHPVPTRRTSRNNLAAVALPCHWWGWTERVQRSLQNIEPGKTTAWKPVLWGLRSRD